MVNPDNIPVHIYNQMHSAPTCEKCGNDVSYCGFDYHKWTDEALCSACLVYTCSDCKNKVPESEMCFECEECKKCAEKNQHCDICQKH